MKKYMCMISVVRTVFITAIGDARRIMDASIMIGRSMRSIRPVIGVVTGRTNGEVED